MTARSLPIVVCLLLVAALLPSTAFAAQAGQQAEYIVTLRVQGSDKVIAPSSATNRVRIAARAERAVEVTSRLGKEHGVKPRHRYNNAITGFSATMTRAEARALAQDPKVANVKLAQRVWLAAQTTPAGVKRVNAVMGGAPKADVNAHVAVLDTGIGPSRVDGQGLPTGQPLSMQRVKPQNKPELNIRGGVNCYDDPTTEGVDETKVHAGWWADTQGHGTHVAGIIGARDNSVGTVGVAPGAKLWSVRVFDGLLGSDATVLCGLEWVVSRNSDADPGNDIDVINMSMEKPRQSLQEDCDVILADPHSDPIHVGVCKAERLGVTVVAAAGNRLDDANDWAPGGYDNVISVGAMTDTDGAGWGKGGNATCTGYTSQRDDAYATGYSNRGLEVDIVAPGTCITSTRPTQSGAATAVLTGTSMAAPHVTGAVARYLADHPGTSPERMRRLVRASGQLNWDARTDPVWSGTADPDAPNRVLDVAWLTGGQRLKVWAYHSSFEVAGSDKSRTTRVDVQRGGGFPGAVSLTTSGLPVGVSATFEDKTLDGLDPSRLGTNLHLAFDLKGQEGRFGVGIKGNGPGVAAFKRKLSLTVDRTGPTVSGLGPKVRKAAMARNGTTEIDFRWNVSDAVSKVARAQLQRLTAGAASYRNVPRVGLDRAPASLKPGQQNRFRVKAVDSLGNTKWSSSIAAKLSVRDSRSTRWREPSGWTTKQAGPAFGGSFLLAKGATDSLSTDFYGAAVAIAAPVGPGRGRLRVRIDGGPWQTVSLKSGSAKQRRVVWSKRLTRGAHRVDIQGKSGQATVDALIFVR